MQPLIDNARTFGQRPEEFAKLADGQSPEVLFITCAGSGSGSPTGEAATLEYAVEVLVHTGAVREHRVDTDSFEALRGPR